MHIGHMLLLFLFFVLFQSIVWCVIMAIEMERSVTIEHERKDLVTTGSWAITGVSLVGLMAIVFLSRRAVISLSPG